MAKPAQQSSKKRKRENEDVTASSAAKKDAEQTSSSSSSDDDEDDKDSESDSDDDETENALFRPAPVKQKESGSSDSDSSSNEESESDDDDKEEEEPEDEQPMTKQAASAKSTEKKNNNSKPQEAEVSVETKNLQAEIEKKTEATVYVEGIPYKADEGDLVSHFASCGIVKEVRMPRYQDSGKPRGYAHVVFESESSIKKALNLDGKYLFGRYLTVRRAETPRVVEMALKEQKGVKKAVKGCRTVFIKQLPYEIDEQTIRDALGNCGTITSVRLPLWNHTKKLKGFGYVEFSKEEEAVAAAKRSGMKIGDRMVIINLDVAGAPKASFRQRDGQFWSKGEEAKKSLAKILNEKQQRRGSSSTGSVTSKKRKTSK